MSLHLHEPHSNRRNILERRRRKRVTVSCARLRKLLPAFEGRQEDMASILEMTVEYLKLAHRHLPKDQRAPVQNPVVPGELQQAPKKGLLTPCAETPIPAEDAPDGICCAPRLVRLPECSRDLQAPREETEESPLEQTLAADRSAEATALLTADFIPVGFIAVGEPVTSGHPRPPEEGTTLLCAGQDPSPFLSSTSLSLSPGLSVQDHFLADGLRSSPPVGLNWSASELKTQGEVLFGTGAESWQDEPGARVKLEGGQSRDLLTWLKEQEKELLPESEPQADSHCSWESESTPQYFAWPEEIEKSLLETYGLLTLEQEAEPVSGSP